MIKRFRKGSVYKLKEGINIGGSLFYVTDAGLPWNDRLYGKAFQVYRPEDDCLFMLLQNSFQLYYSADGRRQRSTKYRLFYVTNSSGGAEKVVIPRRSDIADKMEKVV